MRWGWNPDSLAAAATVGAAVAAIVAGYFAWLAYSIQRAEQVQRHAQQLAAWEARETPASAAAENCLAIVVQNSSSLPFYRVRFWVKLGMMAPVYAGWMRVVPPTGSTVPLQLHEGCTTAWDIWRSSGTRNPTVPVEFTFLDASGTWWLRSFEGGLTRINESDAYRYRDGKA
ncbi:hypothetical protein [Nocardioides sp. SYSU DS0651]|uniref:hypothetical protein n=1 Tax=Nocardioides sp. SYSU DS0651 TaxID=3415955 RepID=UPI003F4B0C34